MRTIGTDLKNSFLAECTTIAVLWKITLTDNTVIAVTNHNQDITFDSVLYKASDGFIPTEIALKSDFSVSNIEVESYLSDTIERADLVSDLFDGCSIKVYYVNYEDIAEGGLLLLDGTIGEVNIENNKFSAEIRGKTEKLQRKIGFLYSPTCRANLGDAQCGVNLASYTTSTTVTNVTDNQIFQASSLTQLSGYFDYGYVEWTSGNNNGKKMEVKRYSDNTEITLVIPMAETVQVGDTFDIVAGCNKAFTTCKSKFNNVVNFRGEPYVPGPDAIFQTSGTRSYERNSNPI